MSHPCAKTGCGHACPDNCDYRFFTETEISKITGLGRDAVGLLVKNGAPVFARKINLRYLFAWLDERLKNDPKFFEKLKVRPD